MTLWLAGGITLAVAFVIGLMMYSMRMEDIMNSPSPGTEQSAPALPGNP